MPKPISRKEIIRRFRKLGWDGPYAGGKHSFMCLGSHKIRIPNPHGGDVDWSLMKRILIQANINPKTWNHLT